MKRLFLILVVIIGLMLMTISCSEDKPTEPKDEDPPAVREETIVIDEETSETILEVDDDHIIFPDDVDPSLYEEGRVVVAAPSENAPYGLLRKVVGHKEEDGRIVVETVQARLEDVFNELDLSISQELRTTDIKESFQLLEGVTFNDQTRNPYDFPYNIEHVIDLGNNVAMRIEGNLNLTLGYDLDVKIGVFRGLHYVKAGGFVTSDASLELGVSGGFEYEREIPLYQHNFHPIIFTVGVVPIVIVPKVIVLLEIDASGTASVVTSVSTEARVSSHLIYDKPNWSQSSNRTIDFEYVPPTLSASLNASVGAGPQFEVNLYGVAGPYVKGIGYLELDADIELIPWWKLTGGFKADAGVKFEALGYEANYDFPNIIHYYRVIAEAPRNTVATPTFTPPAGEYNQTQNVTINCATPQAIIRYTTNGDDPTSSSTVYTNPIAVDSDLVIKAKGFRTGWTDSDVATAQYTISDIQTVATPTFTPPGGEYNEIQNVTINCATPGVTIRYTLDGSEPTTSSLHYSSPVTIDRNLTLKARAFKPDWNNSAVREASYTFLVSAPTFSPPGDTYDSPQDVTINCTTQGATIRYTTNGDDPTSSSPIFTNPIRIDTDTTVKARAFRTGWNPSFVSSVDYVILPPETVADPYFDPPAGNYDSPQQVSILCITQGATIRYTTNGQDPTENSSIYSTPIAVDSTTTIKARAYKDGWNPSEMIRADYTIEDAPPPPDMVFVEGGTFTMGDRRGEGRTNERPTHEVTLDSFYIGKYTITQKEWTGIMGAWQFHFPDSPNNPAERSNWYATLVYCNLRSIRDGLTPVYSIDGSTNPDEWGDIPSNRNETWDDVECDWDANGYRLPTESEWEYAARGGTNNPDYLYSGGNNIDDVAWYNDNSEGRTHPVGQKYSNGLGLFDMSGNVWEWCWNWFEDYTNTPKNNPRGPLTGNVRVRRGASWHNNPTSCRVSYRHYDPPHFGIEGTSYGFRVARRFP